MQRLTRSGYTRDNCACLRVIYALRGAGYSCGALYVHDISGAMNNRRGRGYTRARIYRYSIYILRHRDQTDGGTGAGLSFPICGLSLSVCRCCAYSVTVFPSGNWKLIRRSAPRAAAIRCHSSSVNFPVDIL